MTADITTGLTIRDGMPLSNAYREIFVETAATADGGDTFTITLASYGCTKFLAIDEYIHTTEDSVVVGGMNAGGTASTTSVTAGVLTVTLSGSTTNQKRVFRIIMR
jgi:hypothetical protein